MEPVDVLRWLHVIGAAVLLGTGAGIAFFMLMAHRTADAAIVAATARIGVHADSLLRGPAAARCRGWGAPRGGRGARGRDGADSGQSRLSLPRPRGRRAAGHRPPP